MTCVEKRLGYDADKHPKALSDTIAEMLQTSPLEGDDRPYYSFSATIDAFVPPQ